MRNIFILFSLFVLSVFASVAHCADYNEYSVGKLRVEGAINSTGVEVLLEDGNLDILSAQGTTVPSDATTGYAKGCVFLDTDVASGISGYYVNLGTNTSCKFRVAGHQVAGVSSVTAIATTGATTSYITAPESSTLTSVYLAGATGVGSSSTNYITFTMVNLGQAGAGSTDMLHGSSTTKPPANGGLGTLGTDTAFNMTLTSTTDNRAVVRGDRIKIVSTVTGTLPNTITYPTWMLTFGGQ